MIFCLHENNSENLAIKSDLKIESIFIARGGSQPAGFRNLPATKSDLNLNSLFRVSTSENILRS